MASSYLIIFSYPGKTFFNHYTLLRHSSRYILALPLFIAFLVWVTACDDADGPTHILQETPVIYELSVDPSSLCFADAKRIGDTLITFQVTAKSDLSTDYNLVARLVSARGRSELATKTLRVDEDQPGTFYGTIPVIMKTSAYENLIMYVYPSGFEGVTGNRAESTIKVRGMDTGKPEVLEIHHPDTVIIPETGQPDTRFPIAAKVTHTVSMDFIDRVQLDILDETNQNIFRSDMPDDHPDFDNEPGDSIYIQGLSIGPDNSPASYSLEVHAVDIAGTVSDTLRSTLIISR